jgi:hypothetical protein
MPVRLNSSGGGSVTMDVPAVGTTTTLNLPTVDGTLIASDNSGNVTYSGTTTFSGNATFNAGLVPSSSFLRNRIINGAMSVSQRNSTSSVNVSSDSYSLDRWLNRVSGGGVIANQQSTAVVPTGFAYSAALTVQTADASIAAGDVYDFEQRIEGFNTSDLGWGTASAQTVTLSFWVRSSVTGTYGVGIQSAAYTRSYVTTYTVNVANTWEFKTLTIPGDTSGTQNVGNGLGVGVCFDLGSGSNSNTTAGAWGAGGGFFRTSGCVNWIANAGATFYLTGVQFEVGSVATPFERRQYGQELMLCQRYYERGFVWRFITTGTSNLDATTVYWKAQKRAAATTTVALSSSSALVSGPFLTPGGGGQGEFAAEYSFTLSSSGFCHSSWTASSEL